MKYNELMNEVGEKATDKVSEQRKLADDVESAEANLRRLNRQKIEPASDISEKTPDTQSKPLTEQVIAAEVKLNQSARQLDSSPPVEMDPKPKLGEPGVEPGITDPNVIAGAISGKIDSEINKPYPTEEERGTYVEEDIKPKIGDPGIEPGITNPEVIAKIMGKTIEGAYENRIRVGEQPENKVDQKPLSESVAVTPQGNKNVT
jgi:hypothetical protein